MMGSLPNVAEHGALDSEELERLGIDPDSILDFSANIMPFGPSPKVHEAVANVPIDRYPDRHCLSLCTALSELLGVSPECILPGNGASELIWLTALACLKPGAEVLVLGPTFSEYARASRLMGACVTTFLAGEETQFHPEPAGFANQLQTLRPRLAFMCNPNNPTGTILTAQAIAAWARHHPQTLFVVDEAYLPFAADLGSAVDCETANMLVLRSMTKDFGLAGLRLGYAVANRRLIATLQRAQPPWSVNALAQAAGVAALQDLGHRQRGLDQLAAAKLELVHELTCMGMAPLPSAVHYMLLRVANAAKFRQALLRRGVLIRDCASFGLPNHVRIAVRGREDNARLLDAIREVR